MMRAWILRDRNPKAASVGNEVSLDTDAPVRGQKDFLSPVARDPMTVAKMPPDGKEASVEDDYRWPSREEALEFLKGS